MSGYAVKLVGPLWEVPIDLVCILDEFSNIHLRPRRSAKLLQDSVSKNSNFYGKWVHFEGQRIETLNERPNFHRKLHRSHPGCNYKHIRATNDEKTPPKGRQTLRKRPKTTKIDDFGSF